MIAEQASPIRQSYPNTTKKSMSNPFGSPYIRSDSLTFPDIPLSARNWRSVVEFAATLDPQAELPGGFDITSVTDIDANSSITEMRLALYSEWRRHNHFGYGPDTQTIDQTQYVLDSLRRSVSYASLDSVCEHLREACRLELANGNTILRIDIPAGSKCPLAIVFCDTLKIWGTPATGEFDPCVRYWESKDPHYEIEAGFICDIHRHVMSAPTQD